MNDFLSFRKFITPVAIQVLFWIGLLVVVIGAIVTMASGQALRGLLLLIVGPIMVRIYCELLILAFRGFDELVEIRKNTSGQSKPPTQV
jgi:hypothetical protein